MEIREGYKKTEVGVIPEDWEVKSLKEEIESLDAGVSVNSVEGVVRPGDIAILKTSAVFYGHFFPCESKLIHQDDITRAKLNPKRDNLIISRMNTPDLVGECGYVDKDYDSIFLPDRLWQTVLKRNSALNCRWLSYILNTTEYRRAIKGMATGTSNSMKNIAKEQFLSIKIPYPEPNEQAAIAEALSDVDNLISSLTKLINKKKNIKQGAMQELLTGKKRLEGFSKEWIETKLNSICMKITTGKLDANAMKPEGQFRFYTCAKDYFLIDEYAFDEEALLISGNGANVGYIHYYKGKFNAYQRTYVITGFTENILFIKFFLEKHLADRISKEVNAGNTPYIKMDTLTDMVIALPITIEEQTAIANILSDMDAEIEALEQKLNKYKAIKQGMMQELLTGRIRLV